MTSNKSSTSTRLGRAASAWCRVLVVEQGEGLWGAQRYLLRLAPLLEDRGVEQVLAAPEDSATAEAWTRDGRRHVVLSTPRDRALRNKSGRIALGSMGREIGRTVAMARRTARLAVQIEADVLHANSHWSHLEGVLAARLCRRPVVLHLHEENMPDAIGRLRGLAVMGSDATVAVSSAVALSLPSVAAKRVEVIRNGIDATAFRPGPSDPVLRAEMAADPKAPVLLSASRLDPKKGIENIIRAVAGLPEQFSHTQLAVVGSSSLDFSHAEYLRSLGQSLLGRRIRFLGQRTDVANLMRSADALVLASYLEGLPLGILEAQACGLPVVAFPTAGIPEVVVDGVTGLLSEPTVPSLTTALAKLLSDPPHAAALSVQARAEVESQHTLERQADLQVTQLRSILRTG